MRDKERSREHSRGFLLLWSRAHRTECVVKPPINWAETSSLRPKLPRRLGRPACPAGRIAASRWQTFQSRRFTGPRRPQLHSHDVWGLRAFGGAKMIFVKSKHDHFLIHNALLVASQGNLRSAPLPHSLSTRLYLPLLPLSLHITHTNARCLTGLSHRPSNRGDTVVLTCPCTFFIKLLYSFGYITALFWKDSILPQL